MPDRVGITSEYELASEVKEREPSRTARKVKRIAIPKNRAKRIQYGKTSALNDNLKPLVITNTSAAKSIDTLLNINAPAELVLILYCF